MENEYKITPQAAPAAPVQVAVDVDGAAMIADLSTAVLSYCSMQIESTADKIKAYNAMANTSDVLAEHIGEEIPLRNVYVEVIECENPTTGEKEKCPRIVLIASDGRTFQAVSRGVFGSLKQIFNLFGTPETWDFALVVKTRRVQTRKGYYTHTLEAIGTIPDPAPAAPAVPGKK